jgi:hypothetical protein
MADDDAPPVYTVTDDADRWPDGTPEAVEVMSTTLWKFLRSNDLNVSGPSMALVFARLIFVAGKHKTGKEFAEILGDVHKMIVTWGAAYDPRN